MIITCPNCNKEFSVKDTLIPENGRLLQCGDCSNKWFFSKNIQNEEIENKIDPRLETPSNDVKPQLGEKVKINENSSNDRFSNVEKSINQNNTKKKDKDITKKFLSTFLVILISFIAIIFIVDTFKLYIANFLPGIIPLLDNLYATLFDLQLFIKDLFN